MATSKNKQSQKSAHKKRPRWCTPFLVAFRETGNIRAACDVAGIDRSTPYHYAKKEPWFKVEWDAAQEDAADLLEKEARRRAYEGVRRLKFHKGEPIMVPLIRDGEPARDEAGNIILVPYVEHEYSDTLAIFLLKGMRPEKYRESYDVKQHHTGEVAQVHVYVPKKDDPPNPDA